jgi:dTDP-4-dehydrorhamnose reductase
VKVLVSGAGGELGGALLERVPQGITAEGLTHASLNVADEKAVDTVMRRMQPAVVINAAGFTQVDAAESAPEQALRANAEGPRVLAAACARTGARLVQVSTDYVFDGEQNRPYRPTDATSPLSLYGLSKLEGEAQVSRLLGDQACIVRTSWLYSARGQNFVTRMLERLKAGTRLRIVSDQIGAPTATFSLADVLWRFAHTRHGGIFHWSDAGVASWYDLTVAIAEEGHALGLVPADYRVDPIESSEYPTPARRPRYSLLDRRTTEAALSVNAAHWRVNLRTTLRAIAGSPAS